MSRQIGPVQLPEVGHKRSGTFTFDDPELGKYQWPFFAISGAAPGLTFLLTAGIHAAEYTGTLAAMRLGRMLDASQVSGTVLVLPLLNVPGFYERSVYVNPEDNENLNRAFPGRPGGKWSERFAHHLLNDIVVHVDRAMDLHAGDMIEDLEPFLSYHETGDADVDQKSRQMLDAHGGARWAVRAASSGVRAGTLYGAAAERGVPSILAESGGCGQTEESAIQRHVEGVLNIWRSLGMLADRQPGSVRAPHLLSRADWLRSEHEGVFLCRVRPSDEVKRGQPLGEMVDLLGNHLAEVTAPADGVILFTVTSPAIKKDGLLLAVGVL